MLSETKAITAGEIADELSMRLPTRTWQSQYVHHVMRILKMSTRNGYTIHSKNGYRWGTNQEDAREAHDHLLKHAKTRVETERLGNARAIEINETPRGTVHVTGHPGKPETEPQKSAHYRDIESRINALRTA